MNRSDRWNQHETRYRLLPALTVILVLLTAVVLPPVASAAAPVPPAPAFGSIELRVNGGDPQQGFSLPIRILFFLSILTFIPAILISLTCFTRIIIVFHFLRQAIGTQETPSSQILVGLALFMTIFIMQPVGQRIYDQAIQPLMKGEIKEPQAFDRGVVPLREFMLKYTRKSDIALFLNVSRTPKPKDSNEIPITVLIPSYMISELKTAFEIGVILFIPFLIGLLNPVFDWVYPFVLEHNLAGLIIRFFLAGLVSTFGGQACSQCLA